MMPRKSIWIGIMGIFIVGMLAITTIVLAGELDPGAGPSDPSSQMYTLEQIFNRLFTGEPPDLMTTFTEPPTGARLWNNAYVE